ncbi:hypothetical protein E2C01_023869 [Portunus trituberculatus]|uniref:Uncharacterized protein n=1 Tax=Portunus trituberculatus TaxID=210409 RepID=A0A5B7E9A3_PORTR|nr:hypothetical protein [Portunus trituberculatus]
MNKGWAGSQAWIKDLRHTPEQSATRHQYRASPGERGGSGQVMLVPNMMREVKVDPEDIWKFIV